MRERKIIKKKYRKKYITWKREKYNIFFSDRVFPTAGVRLGVARIQEKSVSEICARFSALFFFAARVPVAVKCTNLIFFFQIYFRPVFVYLLDFARHIHNADDEKRI